MSDGLLSLPSNIFPFLNFRLITNRDILALEYIHYKLFPIKYGRVFYEKICNEVDTPESLIHIDESSSTPFDYNDDYLMKWNAEHLVGIGVFYKYRKAQSNSDQCSNSDLDSEDFEESESESKTNSKESDRVRISNLFLVGDEYLIGIITFLMNFPEENFLQSGDAEYKKIYNYYKLLQTKTNSTGRCGIINTKLVNKSVYDMLIECLYSNDVLLNRLHKILDNKSLESVYILTAGVIESFQRKGIGTSMILFVQLLFQRILYDNVLTLSNNNIEWISTSREEFDREIPPFIYLHVLEYNEAALRMYYNANLVNITTVENYYSIDSSIYNANMLCCYIEPQDQLL